MLLLTQVCRCYPKRKTRVSFYMLSFFLVAVLELCQLRLSNLTTFLPKHSNKVQTVAFLHHVIVRQYCLKKKKKGLLHLTLCFSKTLVPSVCPTGAWLRRTFQSCFMKVLFLRLTAVMEGFLPSPAGGCVTSAPRKITGCWNTADLKKCMLVYSKINLCSI